MGENGKCYNFAIHLSIHKIKKTFHLISSTERSLLLSDFYYIFVKCLDFEKNES